MVVFANDALRHPLAVGADPSPDLETDEWLKTFRGRDVLRGFVSEHVPGVSYEAFRDLVLARMKEAGLPPPPFPEPREADDGPRTRDLRLGKPTLYQLSYVRVYIRGGSPVGGRTAPSARF
jgi:hypothetical protein